MGLALIFFIVATVLAAIAAIAPGSVNRVHLGWLAVAFIALGLATS